MRVRGSEDEGYGGGEGEGLCVGVWVRKKVAGKRRAGKQV